jgi:hypothetical protein
MFQIKKSEGEDADKNNWSQECGLEMVNLQLVPRKIDPSSFMLKWQSHDLRLPGLDRLSTNVCLV